MAIVLLCYFWDSWWVYSSLPICFLVVVWEIALVRIFFFLSEGVNSFHASELHFMKENFAKLRAKLMGQSEELIKLTRLETDWNILLGVPNEAKIEQSTIPPKQKASGQGKRSSTKQKTGWGEGGRKQNCWDMYMGWKSKGNVFNLNLF